MLNLLSYWQPIAAALATAVIAFALHTLDVGAIKAGQVTALNNQAKMLVAVCDQSKQLAAKESHDYQTELAAARAGANKLRANNVCVPIARSTGGLNGPNNNPGSGGQNGVSSNTLYSIAEDCKEKRLQLNHLQKLLRNYQALIAKQNKGS